MRCKPGSQQKTRKTISSPTMAALPPIREATGMGIRLDGGTAYAGGVITRYYDSLLTKVTAKAPTPDMAIARMDRALREFRIRGVSTNIAFVENLLKHPTFCRTNTQPSSSTRRRTCSPSNVARPRDQSADLYRRHHGQRPSERSRTDRARAPTSKCHAHLL